MFILPCQIYLSTLQLYNITLNHLLLIKYFVLDVQYVLCWKQNKVTFLEAAWYIIMGATCIYFLFEFGNPALSFNLAVALLNQLKGFTWFEINKNFWKNYLDKFVSTSLKFFSLIEFCILWWVIFNIFISNEVLVLK